jgi:hypothetical protein
MRAPPIERLTRASEGKPFFRLLVASKAEEVLVFSLIHDGLHVLSRHDDGGRIVHTGRLPRNDDGKIQELARGSAAFWLGRCAS